MFLDELEQSINKRITENKYMVLLSDNNFDYFQLTERDVFETVLILAIGNTLIKAFLIRCGKITCTTLLY